MKAIGVGMSHLAGIVASQVCIIAVCGAVIADLLTFAMAAALPETMPFYLEIGSACLVTIVFIMISIISSLISILNISHVDPMKVIEPNAKPVPSEDVRRRKTARGDCESLCK